MRKTFLPLLLAGCSACGAELPNLRDSHVSIPYDELRSLWHAAEQAKAAGEPSKPAPPVPFTLQSARYTLQIEEGQLTGTVEFSVNVLADGWHQVPLLGATAQIDRIEPADAQIIIKDGLYQLLVNKPGACVVRISCAFPLPASDSGAGIQSVRIPTPITRSAQVEISGITKGMESRVNGATVIRSGSGTVLYRITPAEAFVVEVSRTLPAPMPSRWTIEPQLLVRYAEGRLSYLAHISADAPDGSGLSMALALPRGARVLGVQGEDLDRWRSNDRLEIAWRTRGRLIREFDLTYEVPQTSGVSQWQLTPPTVIDGENREPCFAVIGQQGLELTAMTSVTPRLSKWLADQTARQPVVWAGADGKVQAVWLPVLATTPAVVETSAAKTRLVEDGALLTEVTYNVKAGQALPFRLSLPPEVQVIRCTMAGATVNPVIREKNTIEFSLCAAEKPVAVSVVYTGRTTPLNPVSGDVRLELPRTDLLIHVLDWELSVPARYALAGFEGNLTAADPGKGALIHFRKELCRNEQPGIRLFYEKPEVTR